MVIFAHHMDVMDRIQSRVLDELPRVAAIAREGVRRRFPAGVSRERLVPPYVRMDGLVPPPSASNR